MRCFLALPVPEPLLPALLDAQEAVAVGRAVPEENLHLTLAFLGEQPDFALAELDAALMAAPLPGCTLALEGLESFGGRRVKLLAAGVTRAPELVALRERVQGALRAAGIALPRERFRPHVTLRRFGNGLREADRARFEQGVARFAALRSAPEPVAELRLVSSQLTPEGAVYETLAVYPLAG
ncbi:RNA 2',3'-cyclic phosphodiesterase [Salipiger abyssi]|uniref:RNA 2',3'-cyclic phosphodiesterase n=1 Tax=Salipiger abyssi TaxID=1250539 RepID=A0A1P8URV0_9RHOB|nr:RNA 2',3'-cyclic phosphodiesterase [Salipiger abyssi]APZ52097.1 2'-5' RNA ligase [Salipiger abyssi]